MNDDRLRSAVVQVSVLARALPATELLVELGELLAQPQEADLLVDIGVLKLCPDGVEHGIAAAMAEVAVMLDRAVGRSAGDHEEVRGSAPIGESPFQELQRPAVELGAIAVELQQRGAIRRGERIGR